MSSKKLEKIARQYRIDPATLPPVDGKSLTVNITDPAQVSPVLQSKESRQSEHDRLRAEAQTANRRLKEYERAIRDQRIAARAR